MDNIQSVKSACSVLNSNLKVPNLPSLERNNRGLKTPAHPSPLKHTNTHTYTHTHNANYHYPLHMARNNIKDWINTYGYNFLKKTFLRL